MDSFIFQFSSVQFSSVQFSSVQHRDLSWDRYFVSPFTSLGQQARKLWVGKGPEVSHLSSGLSHRRKAVNKFVGPGDSFGQESLGFGQESWIHILKELRKVGLLVCNRSYSLSLLLVLLLLASVWVVPLDVGNILRHGMACGKDSQDYGEDG